MRIFTKEFKITRTSFLILGRVWSWVPMLVVIALEKILLRASPCSARWGRCCCSFMLVAGPPICWSEIISTVFLRFHVALLLKLSIVFDFLIKFQHKSESAHLVESFENVCMIAKTSKLCLVWPWCLQKTIPINDRFWVATLRWV